MSDENGNKPSRLMIIAIVAIVALCVIGYIVFQTEGKYDRNDVADIVGQVEASKVDFSSLVTTDAKARQLVVDAEFDALLTALKQERSERQKLDASLREMITEIDQKSARRHKELADTITDSQKEMIELQYKRDSTRSTSNSESNIFGDALDLGDAGNLELGTQGDIARDLGLNEPKRNPYGDGYIVLYDNPIQSTGTSANSESNSGGIFGDALNVGSQIRSAGNNIGENLAIQSTKPKVDLADTESSYVENPSALLETYIVPAYSYADVTTLHGVRCPVGAQSTGASSGVPPRPIVIPIRGLFKGPNGSTSDLGTAHLYGFCSGFRSTDNKKGYVEIKIVSLSYWDSDGGAQRQPASGYIVDAKYNQEIVGELENAKMSVLGKQALAAGLMAFNSGLAQNEFTSVATDQGSRSVLTGDALKSGGHSGVSEMFLRVAEQYDAQADAAVDTVKIKGGLSLKFVSDLPLAVKKAADPILDTSYWEILI